MRSVWRQGNRFELLPESKRFLPEMFRAVEAAQRWILVELYLMESGRLASDVIAALIRATARGVRVMLLLDGYGALGLSNSDRERLVANGVALRFFNPLAVRSLARNLSRDHRKLVVIDGDVAFTGGFGAIDEFLDAWYEVAIRIEGPVIADWVALFARLWDSPLTRGRGDPAMVRQLAGDVATAGTSKGDMPGRVVWGQGYRYQAIRYSLHRHVTAAQRRIWICTPYFAPTLRLRLRLVRAARRGVDVRLLLPGDHHDHPGIRYAGQRFYGRLLRAGVRIFEFQPTFIHAKFSLADDWSSIGSCNFDHWSLHWNLEANQEAFDAGFADDVAALFERNFAISREIDPTDWASRSRWKRLREWLFGILDDMLARVR
ncbi:phospholipase D-like domain-containing protein [Aidingimonas lacisalsi]|uniref:phospholipase D-like domain-containing protein n=1 Tax=Aidingimonas lacisalsi TaxID=2604086 RepID=UPI0011D1CFE7|nr:phospholipase D-like domain-containing protein [Aidingimonas lacisalsi]